MKRQNQRQLKTHKQTQFKNTPPPPKVTNPPPMSPNSSSYPSSPASSSSPSLFDSMKQGFGFGVGSSIAHKAVDSLFNSPVSDKNNGKEIDVIKKDVNLNTSELYELYNKCLEETNRDIKCNDILVNKN
jgi:hypothetical protein